MNFIEEHLNSAPLSTMDQVADLVQRGALFVINHSGGKDSQAMYLLLRDFVPRRQLVIVHADLGVVEWAGALDHIRATTRGEPIYEVRARRSLLEMVAERGMFPSPEQRQCTSDLKRGPIEKQIRHLTYARKAAGHPAWHLVVNCMGMRADESPGRKKLVPFKLSKSNSKAGREWYDWLPIHSWTEGAVFAIIEHRGQQPHKVYQLGMRRFSCVFCIMASKEDLKTAARLATEQPELLNDPELYEKYLLLERRGQVMVMPGKDGPLDLEQITGVAPRRAIMMKLETT